MSDCKHEPGWICTHCYHGTPSDPSTIHTGIAAEERPPQCEATFPDLNDLSAERYRCSRDRHDDNEHRDVPRNQKWYTSTAAAVTGGWPASRTVVQATEPVRACRHPASGKLFREWCHGCRTDSACSVARQASPTVSVGERKPCADCGKQARVGNYETCAECDVNRRLESAAKLYRESEDRHAALKAGESQGTAVAWKHLGYDPTTGDERLTTEAVDAKAPPACTKEQQALRSEHVREKLFAKRGSKVSVGWDPYGSDDD